MKISAKHFRDDIYILSVEDGGYIGIAMRDESRKWSAYTHNAYVALKEFGEHDTPEALADAMTAKLID